MKTFDFNQTGGLKLVTETLSGLQDAYSIFTGVAKMAGDKAILSGCEDLGTTVTDGYVVIGNETLEFKGAVKQTTVIIKEEITSIQFEDGNLKPFETYRYATFGFSPGAYNWDDFKRVPVLINLPDQISALSTMLNNKIDDLTNAIGYMRKGNIFIGDINGKTVGWTYSGAGYTIQLMNTSGNTAGGDDLYKITFTVPLETTDYVVFTAINYVGDYNSNNDVMASITNKTLNGFDVSFREVSPIIQSLSLDYIIFKK
ncbi:hypothetical protein GCM10022217_15680 [Chryseobacterium ginsenosidimutans]|uniref:hypothetical protein n=1 Tax=Chryseobacterium ginsenosidimutans TaxID=687846 RepID=UPI0031D3977A